MIKAAQAAEMLPEFLSAAELHALTGYARCGQQVAWLQFRRLPHRLDERRVIVSRVHVRDWLAGKEAVISAGINFEAVR